LQKTRKDDDARVSSSLSSDHRIKFSLIAINSIGTYYPTSKCVVSLLIDKDTDNNINTNHQSCPFNSNVIPFFKEARI